MHWIELFEGCGIPAGPIYSIDQTFADPQVRHLGMATPVEHPRLGRFDVVASPLTLSGVSKAVRSPTPDAGAHTAEVLKGLGYGEAEIEELRRQGAIGGL